jgi:UDP-N-acetylglucosamine--N-acetylmuramyl-(pentapeptide) pyrophosphoryl-undecaprenol N-acetylglucosamine transferase
MEADLVKRNMRFTGEKLTFTTIPAAGLHGVGMRALPGNLFRLAHGFTRSRRIINQFQPDVMFYTGGYLAVPMALAGRRIPSLVYVPDIEPGLAIKTVARFSKRIAVTVDASRRYFSNRACLSVTGYPVRPELTQWSRSEAYEALNLQPGKPVLQVIHLTGQLDWKEIQAFYTNLSSDLLRFYHPFPYLHEMGTALASADLVISRAGASTLGEYPLVGLPAILVPYPYAWRYQSINAQYLVQKGAAVMIEDSRLVERLLPTLRSLLGDEDRLLAMRSAMRSLSQPQAASNLATAIIDLAKQSGRGG